MKHTLVGTRSLTLTMATATLVLTACSGAGVPADAPAAVNTTLEAETIMELDLEWAQRFADGDLEWIVALQAEDAVLMAPGAERLQGREAIGAMWQAMIETMSGTTWEPTMARVSSSGDLGYSYGTASMAGPDGSIVPGKYMAAWTKVDGEWKVAADIFNASVQ